MKEGTTDTAEVRASRAAIADRLLADCRCAPQVDFAKIPIPEALSLLKVRQRVMLR